MASNNTIRVLALVGKSQTPQQVKSQVAVAQKKLGPTAQVIDSSTWFKEFFPRCGDWSSWVWETVTGKDYQTRQPRFSLYVACSATLGKGNGEIVQLALRSSLPVLLCEEGSPLSRVTGLVKSSDESWGSQWVAQTKPLRGSR